MFRLAGDGALAGHHLRREAGGEVNIDPAAKADQADALARSDGVARLYPGDDAARHEARDLREADAQTIGAFDENMLTLLIIARLVEVGVEELAWNINDAVEGAGDGSTVDVAGEQARCEARCGGEECVCVLRDRW